MQRLTRLTLAALVLTLGWTSSVVASKSQPKRFMHYDELPILQPTVYVMQGWTVGDSKKVLCRNPTIYLEQKVIVCGN